MPTSDGSQRKQENSRKTSTSASLTILKHIYGIQKDGNDDPICKTAIETQMYRIVFWTLWERERVG